LSLACCILIIYFCIKILSAVDTQFLKLTKIDEIVYQEFRENFKEFQVGAIDVELLKSAEAKELDSRFLAFKLFICLF
jgi:hypothetical protein